MTERESSEAVRAALHDLASHFVEIGDARQAAEEPVVASFWDVAEEIEEWAQDNFPEDAGQ